MAILQLKISLKVISPPVWRRILVEDNITFDRLNNIIQATMGWGGYHLYVFDVGGEEIGIPDKEFDVDMTDSRRAYISKYLYAENQKFEYVYDFGDNWQHTIILEKILRKDPNGKYPICIKGKNACPPDDCGGPWGYKELLEAIKNPSHEEHKEMLEWIGGGKFDPEEFDIDDVNEELSEYQ
ncbi:MAG: plasmid pRiA4b ORF-3 family protein [archaeon]